MLLSPIKLLEVFTFITIIKSSKQCHSLVLSLTFVVIISILMLSTSPGHPGSGKCKISVYLTLIICAIIKCRVLVVYQTPIIFKSIKCRVLVVYLTRIIGNIAKCRVLVVYLTHAVCNFVHFYQTNLVAPSIRFKAGFVRFFTC